MVQVARFAHSGRAKARPLTKRYVHGGFRMRAIFIIILMAPLFSYAQENISCHFSRFHQANHTTPEMTGYVAIDQSLEIIAGKISKVTLNLDGKSRAANSINWVLLEPHNWESNFTTYAGDFGELLVISHPNEKNREPTKWHEASLVSSIIATTRTSIGKCLVQ